MNSYTGMWSRDFFVSTSETAIEMIMLKKFDAELLLGNLSYKQKADIYNYQYNYDTSYKQCSALDETTLPKQ